VSRAAYLALRSVNALEVSVLGGAQPGPYEVSDWLLNIAKQPTMEFGSLERKAWDGLVDGDGNEGVSRCPEARSGWYLTNMQEGDREIQTEFNLLDSIEKTTARQARRSTRSFSVGSMSSLSSLTSSCASVKSLSSLTSLSLSCDEGGGVESTAILVDGLGKRKRRQRDPKKERERRAKRQKVNPRKRGGSKRERIDGGKRKQAEKHVVEWGEGCPRLRKSKVKKSQIDFDLEGIKRQKIRIIPWDGM